MFKKSHPEPTEPDEQQLKKKDFKLETMPFDPRFPNQNQTRYCYQMYLDYYRCTKLKGDEHETCKYFFKGFHTLCPNDWIQKWDDQRSAGTFAGVIE